MKENILDKDVYAIIPTYKGTNIITKGGIKSLDLDSKSFLDNSCRYYGSSLKGRIDGAREMLGIKYKSPIIVSEFYKIVMFPTEAYNLFSCTWINVESVYKYYYKNNSNVRIVFKNGEDIIVNCSYAILDKQVMRASRLLNLLESRKKIAEL